MYQIVVTGPESSGKTTLAQQLAEHYQTQYVTEYARTYLEERVGQYEEKDLLQIAKEQFRLQNEALKSANQCIFYDTSFLVLKIWSNFKYKRVDPWINQQFRYQAIDAYLLCGTEIEWEYDVLREHPYQRDELYQLYKKELQFGRKKFIELNGNQKQRLNQATNYLDSMFSK